MMENFKKVIIASFLKKLYLSLPKFFEGVSTFGNFVVVQNPKSKMVAKIDPRYIDQVSYLINKGFHQAGKYDETPHK
jgi:hypothetical protein